MLKSWRARTTLLLVPLTLAALMGVLYNTVIGSGPPPPPPSTPSPPDDRALDDPMRDMTREEVLKRLGAEIVPAAGPETKGYKIDVAGRTIQLPEDAYIGGLWRAHGAGGLFWEIFRGNSRLAVHKVTGKVLGMEIAPGEEGAFDFLLETLE